MPRKVLSVDEAKQIVAQTLATHGNEIELDALLAALPQDVSPLVARMFSELRKKGIVANTISVDPATGTVSHKVRKGVNG